LQRFVLQFCGYALISRSGLSNAFRAVRGAPDIKMSLLQRQIFAMCLFAQFAFCIKILVIVSKLYLELN